MQTLTVTEMHLCQRCPRLLAYHMSGKPDLWKVGLSGSGYLPGSWFHEIISRFVLDASGRGDLGARSAFIDSISRPGSDRFSPLLEFMQIWYFIPYLDKHSMNLQEYMILALAGAMDRFCRYLVSFLSIHLERSSSVENLITEIFQNAEVLLTTSYFYSDGTEFKVKGRPDALLFDPEKREAVILEYKGRNVSDLTEDLTQTAIYAWLVKQAIGLVPRVEVLYLEEEEMVASYEAEQIQSAFQNLPHLFNLVRAVSEQKRPIPPSPDRRLCAVCPCERSCDRDYGPRSEQVIQKQESSIPPLVSELSVPYLPDARGTITYEIEDEAKRLHELLIKNLTLLQLFVEPFGYIIGPRFIRLKVVPDLRKKVTVYKIQSRAVDLQIALSLEDALSLDLQDPPLIQPQSGYISIDIQRRSWKPVDVSTLVEDASPSKSADTRFPLGMLIDGKVYTLDLADPTKSNILIGGTSGSGKSELLRSIVVGLGLSMKQSISFTLIDLKGETFTDLSDLPTLDGPILMDSDHVIQTLYKITDEMEERYRLFKESNVSDIREYNSLNSQRLKRRVIVIDEYADLILNKVTKQDIEAVIQRIGQKGGAAGFHLILSTQRPDAKVITGIIKANLQFKIALKVTSAINSKIILDEVGAECLAGNGDMLIRAGNVIQRVQSPLVSERDLASLRL